MTSPNSELARYVEFAIRIGALLLLLAGCLVVLAPFAVIIGWAAVIAVALDPTFERLCSRFDGRRKLAAALVVVLLLTAMIVPGVALSETLVTGVSGLLKAAETGTLQIPTPPASIADWPLIGGQLAAAWSLAATNLDALLDANRDKVIALARWLFSQVASLGLGVLQVIVAVIVAGFALVAGHSMRSSGERLFLHVAGENGARFGELAVATTRSVARGCSVLRSFKRCSQVLGCSRPAFPGPDFGQWWCSSCASCNSARC